MKKSLISLTIVSALMGTYFVKNPRFDKFWGKKIKSRDIAGLDEKLDQQTLEDFFLPDSYQKSISYEASTEFTTNKSESYLKERSKLAFHHALSKTFNEMGNLRDGKKEKLSAILKRNLVASVMDKFIKTLYIFKIMNGRFNFNIHFTPKIHQNINLNHELSSNQLISYDNTGELYDLLTEKEYGYLDPRTLSMLESFTKTEGENYQYAGGSINLFLNVLDLRWNPLKPIPRPDKNALKGHILYRRYFRVDTTKDLEVLLKNKNLKAKFIHFKKGKDLKQRYITVDTYKTFNLKNMTPKLDRIEIHFGKLLSSDEKSVDLDAGHLLLYGNVNIKGKKEQFNAEIAKLVYSFDDKKPGFNDTSKIYPRINVSSFASPHLNLTKLQIENAIKEADLIEGLKLNRFHGKLK